ncbi:20241_t:CDS:2, partial [Funneliformis geosporum]
MGGAAQKVPIPVDLSNARGPCYGYRLYFKKGHYNQIETGIWYCKQHIGQNNLSGFIQVIEVLM